MIARRRLVAAVCLAAALLPASALAGSHGVWRARGDGLQPPRRPTHVPEPDVRRFLGEPRQLEADAVSQRPRDACVLCRIGRALRCCARVARTRAVRALVRARARRGRIRPLLERAQLAKLVAARVWLTARAAPETGVVYQVVDTGIRCIRAPCFSLRATVVNGRRSVTLSGLDLAGAGAAPADVVRAHAQLAHGGVLVSGTIRTLAGAGGGPERTFAATRLWLPA